MQGEPTLKVLVAEFNHKYLRQDLGSALMHF